jgi:ATP-dependent Clp protease adaptor protein ClpS
MKIPHLFIPVMAAVPSTRPGTVPVAGRQTIHVPLYKVLLHNDDHNTMEHVVRVLLRVFKYQKERCEQIMLETHSHGVALCTVEPLEQAEHHRDQLQSFSLISTIEPE